MKKKKYEEVDPDFLDITKKEFNFIPIILMILFIIFICIVGLLFVKISETEKSKKHTKKTVEKIKVNRKHTEPEIDSTKEYYCQNNYKLEKDKCVYTITIKATKKYSCEDGRLEDGNCISTVYVEGDYDGAVGGDKNIYIACEEGYKFDIIDDELGCYKEEIEKVPAKYTYTCPDGYNLNNDECTKTETIAAIYKTACPDGYELINNKCKKK